MAIVVCFLASCALLDLICRHQHVCMRARQLPACITKGVIYYRAWVGSLSSLVWCDLQARKSVANVLRLLADAMPPGTLGTQLVVRARYLDWIRDTALFLKQLPRFGEAFWEVSQVGLVVIQFLSQGDRVLHW